MDNTSFKVFTIIYLMVNITVFIGSVVCSEPKLLYVILPTTIIYLIFAPLFIIVYKRNLDVEIKESLMNDKLYSIQINNPQFTIDPYYPTENDEKKCPVCLDEYILNNDYIKCIYCNNYISCQECYNIWNKSITKCLICQK